ncbi:MAG TPA: DNA repair protein RecO [Verrucomicrobiae bacterium]|nr:DNA repair protein RecO [Verrucomicrobiae bacterium]
MRQSKATAIILHAADIFDADRSYLMYTREQGKLRARAKGVRRPKSRLAGNLLPYVTTELEFVVGESGWELIVQAQTHETGGYPEESLAFFQYAELIAETVDKLLPDREAHPEFFDGLEYTLDRMRHLCAKDPDKGLLMLIVAELVFKLLIVLGYHPELERCVVTGEALTPQGLAWSSQVGGVVSEEGMRNMSVPSMPLRSSRTVVLLRQLARPQFVAERLAMDEEVRIETCRVIFDYLQTQLGKPLKSYVVLGQL